MSNVQRYAQYIKCKYEEGTKKEYDIQLADCEIYIRHHSFKKNVFHIALKMEILDMN